MMLSVCSRSGALYQRGGRCTCNACIEYKKADNRRRGRNLYTSGRRTRHWQRLRLQAITRDRVCRNCGTAHNLTVHLDPKLRGQHAHATLADVTTLCASCHGSIDAPRASKKRAWAQ